MMLVNKHCLIALAFTVLVTWSLQLTTASSNTRVSNSCPDGALKYNFHSRLLSSSNVSKVIHYRATVYLHCLPNEAPSTTVRNSFMLWFDSFETSITEYVRKSNARPRRRKLPPSMVQREDPDNPTESSVKQTDDNSYKADDDANSTIGTWFPLPKGPVLFDRLENGTVTNVTFSQMDTGNQAGERIISLKRTIVFAFQTVFLSADEMATEKVVPEYDELGYHFTRYNYEAPSTNGHLAVTKRVTTDDFIQLQRDSVNGGMLSVNMVEQQKFNAADSVLKQYVGRVGVELATNTHPTQVFSIDEDLKSQLAVDCKANLTLLARLPVNDAEVRFHLAAASRNMWQRPEKPAQVLDIVDDPTDYLQDVFSKVEPDLYGKGIETILDEFTESPKDQNILKPLRRALQLETDLFIAGKIKVRKIYNLAMPSIKKQLQRCESMQSWSLCLSFLDLAISASGQFADNMLLRYLENGELPERYRIQLTNMAIFMSYPSDYFIVQLIYRHRAGEAFDDDELEFRNHMLLAIGSGASRVTVTDKTKKMAAEYLNKVVVDKFTNNTCDVGTTALLALNAVGNFLSPAVLQRIPTVASKLIGTVIGIAKECRRVDQVAITALAAISKLHSSPLAMRTLVEYLIHADCQQKALLVAQLMQTMQFDIKSWPARGVNDIDTHFARLVMLQPETLSCDPELFQDYFARKKMPIGSPAFHRAFGSFRFATTRPPAVVSPRPSLVSPIEERVIGSNASELVSRDKRASGDGWAYNTYVNDWHDYNGLFVVIQAPSSFQQDNALYPTRKSILYDITAGTNLLAVYMRAGFFTGKDAAKSSGKLFGRLVVNIQLGLIINLMDVAFMREQTQAGFYGYTRLSAIGFTYMDLPQYSCNITIDQWSYAYQFALPVYTYSFGGFNLNLNADVEVRSTLYLYPSYCIQGDIGIMFKPTLVLAGNAFAEIANTYFGVGIYIHLFIDYYIELSMRAPDGCLRLYHGNDDMTFSVNVYLKLPNFVVTNFDPNPAVSLVIWNILQWLLRMKNAGKWALFGWCPPNFIVGPDTPTWTFDTG